MSPSIQPLHQFLLARFSNAELRRLAAFEFAEIVHHLPGDSVSAAELAMQFCMALQKFGLVDESLFAALERERPRFKSEIDRLRRHFVAAPDPAPSSRPLLVAFVAANPIALPELRLAEEAKSIEDKLRGTPAATQFRFRWSWGAGPDDLLDALVTASPDILHFAGHGGANGSLLLQTADGDAHPVAPAALAELIAARPWRPRLVVLNACYSALLANALRPYVAAVVGMRGEVRDDSARQFAVQLYRALGQRDSLATAFDTARAALRVHNLPDDHLPQLSVRDDLDPRRYQLL